MDKKEPGIRGTHFTVARLGTQALRLRSPLGIPERDWELLVLGYGRPMYQRNGYFLPYSPAPMKLAMVVVVT